MDLKQMKELMAAMERTGTTKFFYKTAEFELELTQETKRPAVHDISAHPLATQVHVADKWPRPQSDIPPSLQTLAPHQNSRLSEEEGTFVTSPMVGTFYSSSSPEAAHFIKVGDTVSKETTVCIIEAMKVMNEVKAGVIGTVLEVLVVNGDPVEFGTKLFRIQ